MPVVTHDLTSAPLFYLMKFALIRRLVVNEAFYIAYCCNYDISDRFNKHFIHERFPFGGLSFETRSREPRGQIQQARHRFDRETTRNRYRLADRVHLLDHLKVLFVGVDYLDPVRDAQQDGRKGAVGETSICHSFADLLSGTHNLTCPGMSCGERSIASKSRRAAASWMGW